MSAKIPTHAWAADKVERRAVADLVPYARNAKLHSDHQIEQLAASIKEWGWTVPVLVDEAGGIIAGHGRVMAAKKLGIVTVPVMVAAGWSDEKKRAYVIADNRLAESGWDEGLLLSELADLAKTGFDMGLAGVDTSFIAELEAALAAGQDAPPAREADPDAEVVPPVIPVSELGDVWTLGNHRIVCGDSTSAESVALCLAGEKPHLMVTDPPYGVKYDPSWRDGVDLNLGKKLGQNGSGRSLGVVENDDRADWTEAWHLFPGDVAYVWHGGLHTSEVQRSLEASKFQMRAQIIWAKQIQVFSRGDYHWKHEPCWYAVRKGKTGKYVGGRKQTTVWEIQNNNPLGGGGEEKVGHSTQKPIECMKRPIENNSKAGDAIYEPFSGSGSTIIAGEISGRRVFAIELNPVYVDVAVMRWEAFAGRQAVHAITGKTFADTRAERFPEG